MHKHLVVSLMVALTWAGCAEVEDGKPCSVASAGAAATIKCADGSVTTLDPGSCTVASNGDGTHTVTCPSGSSVVRDGEQLERGTITGNVLRFGLPPAPGAEVIAVDLDRTVAADATGAFAIDGLAPGLYRLRLSHPGYAPIDLPNVAIFGGVVDVGTHTLKAGRKLVGGVALPTLSPSEKHAAVRHAVGGVVDLRVVDLETSEETFVSEAVEEVEFLNDRFLFAPRNGGGGTAVLVIHDVETKVTQSVPVADRPLPLENALLYNDGDSLQLLRLPGTVALPIEGAPTADRSNDGRFMLLERDSDAALGVLDARTGGTTWLATGTTDVHAFSDTSGRLAFVSNVAGNDWFALHDPATGMTTSLVPAAPTSIAWSPDGSFVVYVTGVDARLYDVAAAAFSDLAIAGARTIEISPSGTFLSYSDGPTDRLLNRLTGESWPISAGSRNFSPSERWLVNVRDDSIEIVDTTDGSVSTRPGATESTEFAGDDSLLISTNPGLVQRSLATGGERVLATDELWAFSPESGTVALQDPITGTLSLVALADGSVTRTDAVGVPLDFAAAGRWLVARSDSSLSSDLFLLATDGLAVLPVDEKVLFAETTRTGLWYLAGEFDPANGPFAVNEPFADLALYWMVQP